MRTSLATPKEPRPKLRTGDRVSCVTRHAPVTASHLRPSETSHESLEARDAEADKISYRHLLSHWGGLCHEAPIGNNLDAQDCTFEEHVESITDTWLKSPVGTRISYSNLGDDLVGFALQRIAGRPFPEFMDEILLGPLGMNDSTFDQLDVIRDGSFARGHVGEHAAPVQVIPMVPAGGAFSSASDLATLISFRLAGGKVGGLQRIDPDLADEMVTPLFAVPGQH